MHKIHKLGSFYPSLLWTWVIKSGTTRRRVLPNLIRANLQITCCVHLVVHARTPRLIGLFLLPLLAKAQPLETGLCRKTQRFAHRWMLLNDHIKENTRHDKSGFIICQKFRNIFGCCCWRKIFNLFLVKNSTNY